MTSISGFDLRKVNSQVSTLKMNSPCRPFSTFRNCFTTMSFLQQKQVPFTHELILQEDVWLSNNLIFSRTNSEGIFSPPFTGRNQGGYRGDGNNVRLLNELVIPLFLFYLNKLMFFLGQFFMYLIIINHFLFFFFSYKYDIIRLCLQWTCFGRKILNPR